MEETTEKKALEAILEEGVDFRVTVNDPGWLHCMGILPRARVFTIRPLKLGTLLRISKCIAEMDDDQKGEREGTMLGFTLESAVSHTESLVAIIALAVTNSESRPSVRLERFLRENLTPKEALKILGVVLQQMEVRDFLGCMASVSALRMTGAPRPVDSTLGRSPEASSNISASPGEPYSGV